MSIQDLQRAKRALRRIMEPYRAAEAEAAEADAGFDAGEWSRGWHDENLASINQDKAAEVAELFGVDADRLLAFEQNEV